MNTDAKSINPLPNFLLQVELVDGRKGEFDFSPYLEKPGFESLRDPSYFSRVQVLYGAATWPNGEDIAPASLAAELKTLASAR